MLFFQSTKPRNIVCCICNIRSLSMRSIKMAFFVPMSFINPYCSVEISWCILFLILRMITPSNTGCFISICHFMTTYISISVKDMKIKLFFGKLMILSLRSKNLNSKIKEINVLLNFSQMFNIRALGYTAHIETLFHSLPNSNKHIGIDGFQGLSYPSLQIIH